MRLDKNVTTRHIPVPLPPSSPPPPPPLAKMFFKPETMPLHSIILHTSKIWKILGQTTKRYLSAATTVMLLLNRSNKDLHYNEVLP